MNPQDQQKLEHLVTSALRDLPSRRAPRDLESRVLAEISRRAALPWWRKSFAHWPLAARGLFISFSTAIIFLLVSASGWISAGSATNQLRTAFATELHWLRVARALFESGSRSAEAILGSISPLWLYGAAATVVALYIALFGLGAAAYRTLYANR